MRNVNRIARRQAQVMRHVRRSIAFKHLQRELKDMLGRLASGWQEIASLEVLDEARLVVVNFKSIRSQMSRRKKRLILGLRRKVTEAIATFRQQFTFKDCAVSIA